MSSTSRNEAVASIAVAQMAEMIEKSMEQVGLAFRHKMSEYHFRPQQLSTRYVCPIMRTSRSSDSCMVCGPGSYFEPRYGHCLPCLYGTYQSGENSLFCRLCPSVLKVSEFGPKGAKSLSQCPGLCKSGFVSQTGLEPCRPCNFGSYQPDVGRTTCVTCGRGISTDLKGSRHFTDCQIDDFCKPGQHYSIFSAKCELCARGFYQPTEGQNFCIKCPLGTTTDAVGTVDKQQCKRRTCEGDTSGPMGYFQSPNYPSEYPSNVVCNWEIGPFKRRRILLVIPEIQLADSNCEDYLVIRKNSSPYSLLSFESCESKSQPQAFVARSKRISVEFRSDSANTAKGFRAHYVTYDESYHRLIEDIIRDSRLYSFQGHDQILQNKKLLNSLFEVIAEPSGYHKYANVSQSIFPKSFIDLLAPKVQRFFQIFGGV